MIAAMHAENQLYLSQEVLAFALDCDPDILERQVLAVLRREARVEAGGYVLIRHRLIAEAACAVLREQGEEIDRWYPFLAQAARKHFLHHGGTPDIGLWNHDLAQHFVSRSPARWPLARRIAKAVYDAEPRNGFLLSNYVSVLRQTGMANAAMAELKRVGDTFADDRALLYEWSTIAGFLSDHGLGLWLAGRSLADGKGFIDARRAELSLVGIGVACIAMFEQTGNGVFQQAVIACGRLGGRLADAAPRSQKSFRDYSARDDAGLFRDPDPQQAISAIDQAIRLGSDHVRDENQIYFEGLLKEPRNYRYTALATLFRNLPQAAH